MPFDFFHPITSQWFDYRFGEPTRPQRLAWPTIARRENTLIAAPTGSGKTLSAFLVCIDQLIREGVAGTLANECKVLYLSPLKALASDIKKNLETPLAEIQALAGQEGYFLPEIRAQVRTGDTPQGVRQAIAKKPPHILVTTPESFYLMLTSERGRAALSTVETVIVDEIHALARDKRGSHLTLSLQRLKALVGKPITMIGLSATQKPVEQIASFLVGRGGSCHVFDTGHGRELSLDTLLPPSPLGTVASHEQWEEIYQSVAEQIRSHRSTLIFVNTRRLAERVAFRLSEILGADQVHCHHGSLSKNRRLEAETMLKDGKLKAIVATASLELGIDIGYIDLVVQIGVPFSIATFLQRIGRSGHAIKATPKGKLVPLTRDELLETLALVRAVRDGELDRIEIPRAPLDILVQQLIAECAGRGPGSSIPVDEAYRLFTGAYPYEELSRETFLKIVHMAAEGYAPGRRRFAYLMWDRLKDRLSVKAGARLAAITSGGSIPEMGDYRVVLEDDRTMVGNVNEDFAIESIAGDIFLLGTHSWQVVHVRGGEVVVRDAHGQPPTIPFWLGEAPGRTKEFSIAVASLRDEIGRHADEANAQAWLSEVTGIGDPWPLTQAVEYVFAQKAALSIIPSRDKIVFERFFDEVGGMQLVIHSPYGTRLNRAWGLALRKRFCKMFDFELQASADDDGIVLSLGPQQSFPIENLFKFLSEENVEAVLVQALLQAPMFGVRWRWNVTRALGVLRYSGGKHVPPALQRFRSEDLLTAAFPAQTACQDNTIGDKEVPDHPLVQQTVKDCLTEAMDIDGLKGLLRDIKSGKVELIAKDTREPSPFAYQLLNGLPYAFLDEAPLEDRRTRSVPMRPALTLHELRELDRMSPDAIAQVVAQAWPEPTSADELYEVLVATPAFPLSRVTYDELSRQLIDEGRAAIATGRQDGLPFSFLVAAESMPVVSCAYDEVTWSRRIELPSAVPTPASQAEARQSCLKGWLEIRGPVTTEEARELFALANPTVYLEAIEATGEILQCKLDPAVKGYSHWCARGLLRRIHRLTVEELRERIRPVSAEDYLEFIFEEHGLNLGSAAAARPTGAEGMLSVVNKLQGFESAALAWERELFAGRLKAYEPGLLDQMTSSGVVSFGRLTPKKIKAGSTAKSQSLTSAVPLSFAIRRDWSWIAVSSEKEIDLSRLSSNAGQVLEALKAGGAQFIDEIAGSTGLLETQIERALSELAAEGIVSCDNFRAFRDILSPPPPKNAKRRRFGESLALGGRWSLVRRVTLDPKRHEERLEKWASLLLARYGIVFRDLLERETLAPSWGELVRVYRRWEARGEVRGGRFITGVSGEQFGLSETHEKLLRIREERNEGKRKDSYAVISSADPLNLVGIVDKSARQTSSASTRLLFEAGQLTATIKSNEVTTFRPVDETRLRALRLMGTFRGRASQPAFKPTLVAIK